MIALPRSSFAPYALFDAHDAVGHMYWPVRYGTGTRYLDETELAEFYRTRFGAPPLKPTGWTGRSPKVG